MKPSKQKSEKPPFKTDIKYALLYLLLGPISLFFIPQQLFISSESKLPSKPLIISSVILTFILPTFVVYILDSSGYFQISQIQNLPLALIFWIFIFLITSFTSIIVIFPRLLAKVRSHKILFLLFIIILFPFVQSTLSLVALSLSAAIESLPANISPFIYLGLPPLLLFAGAIYIYKKLRSEKQGILGSQPPLSRIFLLSYILITVLTVPFFFIYHVPLHK